MAVPDMINRPLTRRSFMGATAALGALAAAAPTASASPSPALPGATGDSRPQTIPALREWTPASGSFQLGAPVRVLIKPHEHAALVTEAETFAADLQALLGVHQAVVVADATPREGDIVLELGSTDAAIGDEGYALAVGPHATITARTPAGVFYGTRTLLQLVRQSPTIPAGSARDWPRYPERGLMMDIARKSYSYDWLAERIRELSYLKLNYLHLHFTDDQGWRVQSDQGLQSEQFLTKRQLQSLIALAANYYITVVPEIDMPGHMGAALANHPEFQLKDKNGTAVPNKIDFTIPAARDFLRSLVEEYLPLFPGPYWHMGTDEFLPDGDYPNYPQLQQYAQQNYGPLATGKDAILGLVNQMNALVRAKGKTLRMWNDALTPGTTVLVDTNVVIEWWTDLNTPIPSPTNPRSPQELLLDGYSIQNSSFYPTYDYKDTDFPPPPPLQRMYEEWAVHRFHGFVFNFSDGSSGLPYHDIDPADPRNHGSVVHFWNDGKPTDLTEAQCAASLFPRLRVMAQKTWESSPLTATYADFQPIIDRIGSSPD